MKYLGLNVRNHPLAQGFGKLKLQSLSITNFRSIEGLTLTFPSYYAAVSGKNNSGKSNLLKALKALFERDPRFPFRRDDSIRYSQDFPIWKGKEANESIKIELGLQLDRTRDSAVFKLAKEFFKLEDSVAELTISITVEYAKDKDGSDISVEFQNKALESYQARTMLKTIRSAGGFQFYNSTEIEDPFGQRNNFSELIGNMGKEDREAIAKRTEALSGTVSSVAKRHQRELSDLVNRLEDKYVVGLTTSKPNFEMMPIEITLGDKSRGVSLEEWGSGTQNRTQILISLFRAKRLSESLDEDTKIAPILVIEEPESFLHPSAQAEFGRVIQGMSEELQIQVIVATHNPYFLSQTVPESNVLLYRNLINGKLGPTEKVEVGSDNWMEPFALNLGLANPEFEPWRELFFSSTSKMLLVEGSSDKEYFEMLRKPEHGANKLDFDGEIFAYGGKGEISSGILLRFIKGRYTKLFVTYDHDGDHELQRMFASLSMERNKQFCAVGSPGAGSDNIEGLLPREIIATVLGANPELSRKAMAPGNSQETKSARNSLKKLFLQEFKAKAVPGAEYFGEFYKLTKIINKAMA